MPHPKGHIPWNKDKKGVQKNIDQSGLLLGRGWNRGTKLSEDWRHKLSLAKIGKKRPPFTDATRKKMSDAIKGNRNQWFGKIPPNLMVEGKFGGGKFANVQRGFFDINGKKIFFRSKWEANYALYLDFLVKQKHIDQWAYEEDMFIFDKVQFGTRTYRPDFKIWNNIGKIEYHEVKGWMTSRSKTQIKRMEQYFPEVKLVIIAQKEYTEIKNKLGRLIGFY